MDKAKNIILLICISMATIIIVSCSINISTDRELDKGNKGLGVHDESIVEPPISKPAEIDILVEDIKKLTMDIAEEQEVIEPSQPIKRIETTPYEDSDLVWDIFLEGGQEFNKNLFDNLIFGDSYARIEGILTFRGGITRDSPSYGTSNIDEKQLERMWEFTTSTSSWGGGAGWTGQPSIVKWSPNIKQIMNLDDKYKADEDFIEAIYASLDGSIYFFDLISGEKSRPPIKVGNPIKGSLSIDPRGWPLLYVGEGIPEKGSIGYNIYSLIDGDKLYTINGKDPYAQRGWGAFDSSGIIHEETDTLIVPGENGILYIASLNTQFDIEEETISIDPELTRYRYKVKGQSRLGIESSVAIHRNLLFFADNTGWIQCVDLTTLTPVWLLDGYDDTDASLTLEVEDGIPYIYSANEVDHQPIGGSSYIKKINGLTGEIIWESPYKCFSTKGDKPIDGGAFATNVIGKRNIDHLVIFTLARYGKFNGGLMVALNKETGNEVWIREMENYAWSSPVDFYDKEGNAYIIQ
ncbi:MAG TPA: pyrrolo-quinoline quinone, partial [Clostridia bacterium]|nr:pyrrolo-quinoline quinone [Clostridia bacterium]